MASYSNGRWTATSLNENIRRSASNPWRADEFASAFPKKNENYGRVDREQKREISVRLDDKGRTIDWRDYCKSGGDWKCRTIDASRFFYRNGSSYSGIGLGDWADDKGFRWRNNINKKIRDWASRTLDKNYDANQNDQRIRDEHRNYTNNVRPVKMQERADAENRKGDRDGEKA